MNTEFVGVRTKYLPATDGRGTKIEVMNLGSRMGKLVPFDYSVDGGERQHEHAVSQAVAGTIIRIERIGEYEKGYYYAVEREVME